MQALYPRPDEHAAVRTDLKAIFVSLELSRSTWVITSLAPGGGEKMSKHAVRSGDIPALLARLSQLKEKARTRTGHVFPIIVIGPDRRRSPGSRTAGLQARRAPGLCDGQGPDLPEGGSAPDQS